MSLPGQSRDAQQQEAQTDEGMDHHQGPQIVADHDHRSHGAQGDDGHRNLAGAEDPRLPAVAEAGPELGREIVTEVPEGREQDIGQHQQHQARRIGLQER